MSTNTLIKLNATADILGGEVFFANDKGYDPEFYDPEIDKIEGDLLPNGMYIRITGNDGSRAYISAYELDKAIQIIGSMSADKASKEDITKLQTLLANKASITDLQLAQSDIKSKASAVDLNNLIEIVNTKADQTTVDAMIETVTDKIDGEIINSLKTTIEAKADVAEVEQLITAIKSKADSSKIVEILNDIETLKNAVSIINDVNGIVAIQNQINYLNNELKKRLEIDDLAPVYSKINASNNIIDELSRRVATTEVNLNKKASSTYVQGQVTELNTAITGLAKKVDSKSDKIDVANKANKNDVENLTKKVTEINSTLTHLESDYTKNYTRLSDTINKKSDKTYVDSYINNLSNAIVDKANKAEVNDTLYKLNTVIENLKSKHVCNHASVLNQLELLSCELNNAIANLKVTVDTNAAKINKNITDITKLKDTTKEHTEQLKQPWVRVLSTKEYSSLRPAKEGMSYSSYYKYPNIVYFVVDFNRPKAIYIGDIQIAKAEQKGSAGFAYTFPISF